MPAATKPVTWFALALVAVTALLIMISLPEASNNPGCPPVNQRELVAALGSQHAEAAADFLAKAEQVNAQRQCVLEGGFGTQTGKFYLAVYAPGHRDRPYHLRYARAELRR